MHIQLPEVRRSKMKIAIITVAGISSRFNEGVPEEERELKAIYTETDR